MTPAADLVMNPVMTCCTSVGSFIMPSPLEGEDEDASATKGADAAGELAPPNTGGHYLKLEAEAGNVDRRAGTGEQDAEMPARSEHMTKAMNFTRLTL